MNKIPKGGKPNGSKWVQKIEQEGRYRACLVCQRYTQVPGINFQDNFALVVNNITF